MKLEMIDKLKGWRKGLRGEGADGTVSCGWIPYRLATPNIPDGIRFVKFSFENISRQLIEIDRLSDLGTEIHGRRIC